MIALVTFAVFCVIALVFAILVATLEDPIHAALSLVGVVGTLSVLFYLLGAPFLAMIQLVVYAGGVLVLILFVIMLLNLRGGDKNPEAHPVQKGLGAILFSALALAGIGMLLIHKFPEARLLRASTRDLGEWIFTRYLLPFEAVTLLLLAGAVGAFLLARKEWK
jgi:NADH-quinone oxidoreductase subunit J